MNKVLIFGGARTGTTTLSHCIRNTMLLNCSREPVRGVGTEAFGACPKDLADSPLIDEPLNNPLRKPRLDKRDGYVITRCFEKAGVLHKLVLDKKGGVAAIRKLTAGQIYKLLDEFYAEFHGIKHLHDVVSIQNNKIILDYAADHDIKILYAHRRGILDVILSKGASKQEGVWHSFDKENRKIIDSTEYKPIPMNWVNAEYEKMSRLNEKYPTYLEFKGLEHLDVCYEDFLGPSIGLEERVSFFKNVLEFIGLEYIDNEIITSALSPETKQHQKNHYEKIPNIKEIHEWHAQLKK